MVYAIRSNFATHKFPTIEQADAYCDEHFLPKVPRPRPNYEPLIVTPQASRKNDGSVVAFIDKQLCFFEKDSAVAVIDTPVEVMITRTIYRRHPEGHKWAGHFDWSSPLAFMLRVVTPDYTLIDHEGFECSGSMCRTTANVHMNGDYVTFLTPGRTGVFEASNVNSGSTWKVQYTAKRPGKVWVQTEQYLARTSPLRAEGLARVEDRMR